MFHCKLNCNNLQKVNNVDLTDIFKTILFYLLPHKYCSNGLCMSNSLNMAKGYKNQVNYVQATLMSQTVFLLLALCDDNKSTQLLLSCYFSIIWIEECALAGNLL